VKKKRNEIIDIFIFFKKNYNKNEDIESIIFEIFKKNFKCNFWIDKSNLLKNSHFQHLKNWGIEKYGNKLKRIYCGTINGFHYKDFHSHCDGISPTLTVIKSEKKFIFGGFTNLKWASKNGYVADGDNWLFVLEGRNPIKILQYDRRYSIYNEQIYLPNFGYDINLCGNCNDNETSFADLGQAYTPPSGITYKSDEAKKFLAGSFNFRVLEIEIFLVEKK
jgi:hypothetical protein